MSLSVARSYDFSLTLVPFACYRYSTWPHDFFYMFSLFTILLFTSFSSTDKNLKSVSNSLKKKISSQNLK